ncbi:MAG: ATP-binding cassette domain-containing protein [Dysgonamonadaceae bacterium]|jgi:cell division transport system ATP-binding protein|nr:ATP-binding cassette domain-containing protein [Dysgonamonadaceae bacterium]
MNIIEYKDVDICHKELIVLREVNFSIEQGEFVYLCGKTGSGKSSLLKSFYAEVPVIQGDAKIFDYDLKKISRRQIPKLRRKIGIIFQDFQLLGDRSVHQNLEFVLKATGWKDNRKIDEQINAVLTIVGLPAKGYKRPHQLSGGEQQRIVIARALLNSPQLIVADEPTGNLDPEIAAELVALLHNISKSGTSVIMATHNLNLIDKFPAKTFWTRNERLV